MAVVQDLLVATQLLIVSTALLHAMGQVPGCVSTQQCFECGKPFDKHEQEKQIFYPEKKNDNMHENEKTLCVCRMNSKLRPSSRTVFVILCVVHGLCFVVVVALKREYFTRPPTTTYIMLFNLGISFCSSALLINQLAVSTVSIAKDTTNLITRFTTYILIAPLKLVAKCIFTFLTSTLVALFSSFLKCNNFFGFQQTSKPSKPTLQKLICPYISTEIEGDAEHFRFALAILSFSYFMSFVYITYLTFSTLSETQKTRAEPGRCKNETPLPSCKLCEKLKALANEEVDGSCKSQESEDDSFVMDWRL